MSKSVETESMSMFRKDITEGLLKKQKELPSKYFYDEKGSDLFEQICELDEYYLTNSELEIMMRHIDEISGCIGSNTQLIELGSGSSLKTRLLLENCEDLAMYIPVDISGSYLEKVANEIRQEFPHHKIHPVAADYTKTFKIPEDESVEKRVIYYPGSTIGNFTKKKASEFLISLGENLSVGDGVLIGIDLKKDTTVLEAAYNDSKEVTAAFNKNILERINRELQAHFDPDKFAHRAFYNHEKNRIEMHLESLQDQSVQIINHRISFVKGETIHTENSYKYTLEEFEEISGDYFRRQKNWMDKKAYFSVQYLERISL